VDENNARGVMILPDEYALPPEPPVGTLVYGRTYYYIRRAVGDSSRCWSAGRHRDDLTTIPAWTWGEVLNDGPVKLVRS
jgi:hypothetical protein